ncbi:hypothetical protein LAZ67_X001588 [Cordylochernes scorpioides]|uniref:HTH CENPB-type domain-containing protein n=1 Tax=Cordylochernes scorpioides TaxID=51811 RepID=A0ABY6LV82_9ARAC|nr:hypothetical protein LAZ67_X001588 [Cordylochernes scorpioides]
MAGERKQTRNSLSLSVKLQILREIEVEKKKKTDVAQKHNIPQSSLSTIIKNSEKIHQQALHAGESSRKRARGSTYADVDKALLQWFKQARSAALPVNGPLLSEKAKTLALEFGLKDFTGSGGWIERWKARHGIKLRNICGESADVNLRLFLLYQCLAERFVFITNICQSFETGRAIGLKEAGWSNRLIARHLCRSDATIRRCWQKWVNNGSMQR